MSQTVYRYQIRADSRPTDVEGPLIGDVLWVKSRNHDTVDFWVRVDPDLTDADGLPPKRRFVVTGTGKYIPDRARYCSSTEDAATSLLIWHLWEICAHDYDPLGAAPAWCRLCQGV